MSSDPDLRDVNKAPHEQRSDPGGVNKKRRVRVLLVIGAVAAYAFFLAQFAQGFGHPTIAVCAAVIGAIASAVALWYHLVNNNARHMKATSYALALGIFGILSCGLLWWWRAPAPEPQRTLQISKETTVPPNSINPTKPVESRAVGPNLGNAPQPLLDQFVGRRRELRELDEAWNSLTNERPKRTVGVVAWGGFGKSALVRQWIYRKLEQDQATIAEPQPAVFWRTFQQPGDLETFVVDAISYFSGKPLVSLTELTTASQRLAALREAIGDKRYILVLDGLEVFQAQSRGDQFGRLEQPFLEMLLKDQTRGGLGKGLCVVTSRFTLADVQSAESYFEIPLEDRPLADDEVKDLLRREGVRKCTEDDFQYLIRVCGRHPLALKTMANLLKRHKEGDAKHSRELPEVFDPPPGREKEQHLWRVLAWYNQLSSPSPEELAVMKVIAHFREPVPEDWLRLLLTAEHPAMRQLAEMSGIREQDFLLSSQPLTFVALRSTIRALNDVKLLVAQNGRYSTHALVQEHFRASVGKIADQQKRYHRSLYWLYASHLQPASHPQTIEQMHPHLEAIYHGCQASMYEKALKAYVERVSRKETMFTSRVLGAVESDLDALGSFFERRWTEVRRDLPEVRHADMFIMASHSLRSNYRFRDALEPAKRALSFPLTRSPSY